MTQYYITRPDGRQEGPYDEAALLSRVAAGKYDADVTVWFEGLAEWEPIGRHFPLPAATSAPPTAAPLPPVEASLPSAADDYTTDGPGSALPEAEEDAPPAEAEPTVRRSKRMSQGQWVTISCIVAALLLLAAGGGYILGKNNPPAKPASSPAATVPAEEEDAVLPTEDDAPQPAEEEESQSAEDIPTPENTADAPAPAAEDEPAPQSSTPEDTADNPFVDDAFTDDTAEPDTPEQDITPAAEDAEAPSTPDTAVQSAESPAPADDTTAAKDTADNEDEDADAAADAEDEKDTPAAADADEDDEEEADEADADAAPKELSADEKKEVALLKKRISNHYKRKANCYKQIALMKHKIKLHNKCRSCGSSHCDSQGITGACRHWYMEPFDGKRIKITHQLPQGAKRYSGIDQAVSSLETKIDRLQKGIEGADSKIKSDTERLGELGCADSVPSEPSYKYKSAAERSVPSYSSSSYDSYDSDSPSRFPRAYRVR